jgi:hypothetical protein
MTGEVVALALTVVVHFAGAAVLIGFIARSSGADLFGWWPGDDDGGGSDRDPGPHTPAPHDDGVPMPDAQPASRRLRDADRLADGYPRPARRPAHPEPVRAPQREREREGV